MADGAAARESLSGPFSLALVSSTPGCGRCTGEAEYEVRQGDQALGLVRSEFPWELSIDDDPAQHPDEQHYLMEWAGYSMDGSPLDIAPVRGSHFFIAAEVARLAQQGAIPMQHRPKK